MRILILFFFLPPLLCFGQQPELVVPIGHTTTEVVAIYSPDGKTILTYSVGFSLAKLWDLKGNELKTFELTRGEITSAAFSPDGKAILVESVIVMEMEADEIAYHAHAWKLNGEPFAVLDRIMQDASCAIFSKDKQTVITGDLEGVITIWELNGQQKQSFEAHNGKVLSITTSPNGNLLLTASLNEQTGELSQILWDLNQQKRLSQLDTFNALVFDPHSQYLIEEEYAYEEELSLINLKGEVLQVFDGFAEAAFSPDGRFLILEKRYGETAVFELATNTFRHFEEGTIIAFSPDDQYLLVDNNNLNEVVLLNQNEELSQTYTDFTTGVEELVFSDNGNLFLTIEIRNGTSMIQLFSVDESEQPKATKKLAGFFTFIDFSPDEQSLLIKNGEEELFLLNFQLETTAVLRGYSNEVYDVFFSEDNASIILSDYPVNKSWNLQNNTFQPNTEEKPFYAGITGDVLWSPDRQYIFGSSADGPTPGLYPETDEAAAAIEGGEGNFEGHTITITAAAFSKDGQLILSGSRDKTARLWNLYGDNLQTFTGHERTVESVAFRPDNQLILTATNKMIKLWRLDSPQEIVSLIAIDSADWIVTTPAGLFDASPKAMGLIHYSVFYERDQEYIVIDIDQLKSRYYEPGLLQKLLGYVDETIRPVGNFTNVTLYPKVNAHIDTLKRTLNISLHERNGGIGKVSVFINGKEVVEEANPLPRGENAKRDSVIQFDLNQYQNFLLRHPDSTNIISVRAYNEEGWLKSEAIKLEYKLPAARLRGNSSSGGGSAWVGELDPKLYVVSIGTSDYIGTQLDLQYADQDATMMARALQSVGRALFTNGDSLEVHCLSTASADSTGLEGTPIHWQFADKKNIQATFDAIKQKAKAEDVVVVYLSGHGVTQGGSDQSQFYYLTQGVANPDALADPATLRAYTVSSEELTKWINDIPALKQVLIIDACNSGQVVENLTAGTKTLNSSQVRALDRMKDRTGMFVLSGSASDKVSYEAGEYGQGLLTYALLQGMLGVATRQDVEGKKVVDVMKLFQYARDEVPRLAASINGVQTPMLGFPSRGASFDIGMVDESTVIPIGNKKPVVIRNIFLNENTYRDDLQLANQLEETLRRETEKGAKADLIYVDVYDYPNAYSLGGFYQDTANGIQLRVKLFQGEQAPVELIIPAAEDSNILMKLLVRKMKQVIRDREK